MPNPKPQNAPTVEAYIAELPADRQPAFERVRTAIHATIPGLTETMAWEMPCFERGEQGPIIALGSQKAYLNLYSCDVDLASKFGDQIKAAGLPKCGKSCVRFTVKKQIPDALLEDILRMREAVS